MNENDKLKEIYDVFMNDDSVCTSCELRFMILEALEQMMLEE